MEIQEKFRNELCSNLPNGFWDGKRHIVHLPYILEFDENKYSN